MRKLKVILLISTLVFIMVGCKSEPKTMKEPEVTTTPTEEVTPTEETTPEPVKEGYIKASAVTFNLSEVKDNFNAIYDTCMASLEFSDSDDAIISISNLPGWEGKEIAAGTYDVTWLSANGYKCVQSLTINNDLPDPVLTAEDVTISLQEIAEDPMMIYNKCSEKLHYENTEEIAATPTNMPETFEVGEYIITWTTNDGSLTCEQKIIVIDEEPIEEVTPVEEQPTDTPSPTPTPVPTEEVKPTEKPQVTDQPTVTPTPSVTEAANQDEVTPTEEITSEPTPEVTNTPTQEVQANDEAKLTTSKITLTVDTSEDDAIAAFTGISVTGTTQYSSVDQNELYAVLDALVAKKKGTYTVHYNAMDGSFSLPLTVVIE